MLIFCRLFNRGWRREQVQRRKSASKRKRKKIKEFVEECLKKGIASPSEMRDLYNEAYPRKVKGELKPYSSDAFEKAISRLGVTPEKRLQIKHEAVKSKELKDIEDYEEVKNYLDGAVFQQIGKRQTVRTLVNLRQLWEWCSAEGYPNPREWNMSILVQVLDKYVGRDEDGQWLKRGTVLTRLGAFNRVFMGRLPKGYSMKLKRPAGELKDFFEFEELNEFISMLEDTPNLSLEGWKALFLAQVNMGCREGVNLKTGILSLKWEDIDYKTKRCKVRDKGSKGKPARLWTQVPLDLFEWLGGWEALIRYHEWSYGYRPTQAKHETGRCFPVNYNYYLAMFTKARRKCKSRISQNSETMRPHIFRKTHGQYCKRIGVSLENICGDTTAEVSEGRYGVGWTDPKVPLRYYLTKEAYEYEEQDQKIAKRLKERVLPQLQRIGLASIEDTVKPLPTTPTLS